MSTPVCVYLREKFHSLWSLNPPHCPQFTYTVYNFNIIIVLRINITPGILNTMDHSDNHYDSTSPEYPSCLKTINTDPYNLVMEILF